MADVIMGVTETAAAAMERVNDVAQLYLVQESKLMPTVTDYSSLAVKGANSIALPKSGGFTVGDKGENTSVDAQALTYAKDQISLDQHRVVQFLLEDIANEQAMIEVIQDSVLKASKDMAADIDAKIIEQIKLASASAPDHVIQYADTVGEAIALEDILAARKLLQDQFLDPKECFLGIGTAQEKNMLEIADFIDASKYGSNEPVMNGEIGKVYGMRVIVHTGFGNETSVWHPSAVGMAFQKAVRVQRDYDLANLAWRYSLDYLAGFEVLDSGKRNVLLEETP